MKKRQIFSLFLLLWFLTSCNNDTSNTSTTNIIESINPETETLNTEIQEESINIYIEASWTNLNNYSDINTNNKKLIIKHSCIWCWRCLKYAPNNFKMNTKIRKVEVISQENINSTNIQKAIKNCPVDSIEIS